MAPHLQHGRRRGRTAELIRGDASSSSSAAASSRHRVDAPPSWLPYAGAKTPSETGGEPWRPSRSSPAYARICEAPINKGSVHQGPRSVSLGQPFCFGAEQAARNGRLGEGKEVRGGCLISAHLVLGAPRDAVGGGVTGDLVRALPWPSRWSGGTVQDVTEAQHRGWDQ